MLERITFTYVHHGLYVRIKEAVNQSFDVPIGFHQQKKRKKERVWVEKEGLNRELGGYHYRPLKVYWSCEIDSELGKIHHLFFLSCSYLNYLIIGAKHE